MYYNQLTVEYTLCTITSGLGLCWLWWDYLPVHISSHSALSRLPACSYLLPFCTVSYSVLQSVNKAMQKSKVELTVGVLDIYGFEIFMVRWRE